MNELEPKIAIGDICTGVIEHLRPEPYSGYVVALLRSGKVLTMLEDLTEWGSQGFIHLFEPDKLEVNHEQAQQDRQDCETLDYGW